MLLLSIFTSARETTSSVTIIMEYLCSPSQARPWPEFYSTTSLYILREVSYQRASVASRKNAGLLTWCLLLASFNRSIRNRMQTCTPPMSIWPGPLTLSAEMAFGESWQSMDAPRYSLPLYDSFMMACWLEFKTTVRYPNHFLSQTDWGNDVSLPPPSSVLFSAMLMDAFRDTDVGISINYCTDSSVFNLRRLQAKPRSYQSPSMTSCLPTTAPSMLLQKLTCNTALTSLPRLTTTLASQSVQRRLKLCTSQPQERHMLNPTSQSMGSDWMQWPSSPTLAAHSQETSLMMKWMPHLLKQVLLLADSTQMCGTEGASP